MIQLFLHAANSETCPGSVVIHCIVVIELAAFNCVFVRATLQLFMPLVGEFDAFPSAGNGPERASVA